MESKFLLVSGASLQCGGLTPLWYRSSVIDNKAASGRRTPKRRPTSRLVLRLRLRLCRAPGRVGLRRRRGLSLSLRRRAKSRRQLHLLLRLGSLHLEIFRHLDVRVAADDVVEHLLRLLLFDGSFRSFARRLRRRKLIAAGVGDEDVTRVYLLFRLAVFSLSLSLFELDDVKTKLALDHVTDLARLQRISSLLKCRYHIAVSEPTEIAAFVFTAVSRKLLRQFPKVFTRSRALQDFFRPGTVLLVHVHFGMAGKVSVNLFVRCRHLVLQRVHRVLLRYHTRVLQHHLEFDFRLLVEPLLDRFLFSDVDPAQALLEHV